MKNTTKNLANQFVETLDLSQHWTSDRITKEDARRKYKGPKAQVIINAYYTNTIPKTGIIAKLTILALMRNHKLRSINEIQEKYNNMATLAGLPAYTTPNIHAHLRKLHTLGLVRCLKHQHPKNHQRRHSLVWSLVD